MYQIFDLYFIISITALFRQFNAIREMQRTPVRGLVIGAHADCALYSRAITVRCRLLVPSTGGLADGDDDDGADGGVEAVEGQQSCRGVVGLT